MVSGLTAVPGRKAFHGEGRTLKRLISDYRDCIGVTDTPRSFCWNSRDELTGWWCSNGRQNGDATHGVGAVTKYSLQRYTFVTTALRNARS